MNAKNLKCLECGSDKIATGIVISQPDYVSRGAYFRPKDLKRFALFGINISFQNNFFACTKCGYIWAKVSPEKLTSVLINKGSDKLKKRLGLQKDKD